MGEKGAVFVHLFVRWNGAARWVWCELTWTCARCTAHSYSIQASFIRGGFLASLVQFFRVRATGRAEGLGGGQRRRRQETFVRGRESARAPLCHNKGRSRAFHM